MGWEHEAKNGRKLEVVYKLRPNHHTDMTSKLPLWSSDSIKITGLNLESKIIGLERLTKHMQYWKQSAISDLAKDMKTILGIRRCAYELSSNLIIECEGVSCSYTSLSVVHFSHSLPWIKESNESWKHFLSAIWFFNVNQRQTGNIQQDKSYYVLLQKVLVIPFYHYYYFNECNVSVLFCMFLKAKGQD